jgi:outer membrane protein TolC
MNRMTGAPKAAMACFALALMAALPARAEDAGLSFDEANRLLLSRSDALAGARANVDSQTHRANSLDYLDYPRVEFDARALASEKTLDVDLGGVKSAATPLLAQMTGSSAVAAALMNQVPNSSVFGAHNSGIQSTVTATLPLYTGGKIDASQKAAVAAVHQASAEAALTEQALRTQLAQIYFLYQLALGVRDVRLEVRDGLKLHLDNAMRAEKAGVTAHAQTLQAQVAYDEAVRGLVQAEADAHTAAVALTNLLHLDATPILATRLFVMTGDMPPLRAFIDTALEKHAQLARLAAMDDQAGQGVRIEGADRLPQVYLFGEYNFTGRNWDMSIPDWAFGLGVKYSLFSGIDRSEAEEAAVQRQFQVQAAIRQTRNDLETAVTRAYNDLGAARDRFRLLVSNIASARENVRIQDVSFREGIATSVDVVDARLALSRAEIDRAQAAYQYDEALSRLLAASGQAEAYSGYIAKADRVIAK